MTILGTQKTVRTPVSWTAEEGPVTEEAGCKALRNMPIVCSQARQSTVEVQGPRGLSRGKKSAPTVMFRFGGRVRIWPGSPSLHELENCEQFVYKIFLLPNPTVPAPVSRMLDFLPCCRTSLLLRKGESDGKQD